MNLPTALLIGRNPKTISSLMTNCNKHGLFGTLYVKVLSELNPQVTNFDVSVFREGIVNAYRSSEKMNADVRIILNNYRDAGSSPVVTNKAIDVVYYDPLFPAAHINDFVQNYIKNKVDGCRTIMCDISKETDQKIETSGKINLKSYNSVVLGGTFDKLHVGHKHLFSEAVLRCKKRLTVGVMCDELLQSKTLYELIDSCEIRIDYVKKFLNDIDPTLIYDVVQINDLYGPTKHDPSFEMIVVSKETKRGAEKINEYRKSKNMNELEIVEVEIIDSERESDYEEKKISSSNSRMRLLGSLIKPIENKPHLSRKPYTIGLTGCIASGKSSISKYLQEFGSAYINCDELGHQAYAIGSSGYQFIKNTFSENVINNDGTINRPKLGSIVFSDPKKLEQLNKGIWPVILKLLKEKIATEFKNEKVVVIEAAALIQAGWVDQCHEVWTCIISPEEVVKRVQKRNNLNEEDAKKRLSAQLTTQEYISNSNVIFCSQWDPSYTRSQVEKAWRYLQNRLPTD